MPYFKNCKAINLEHFSISGGLIVSIVFDRTLTFNKSDQNNVKVVNFAELAGFMKFYRTLMWDKRNKSELPPTLTSYPKSTNRTGK